MKRIWLTAAVALLSYGVTKAQNTKATTPSEETPISIYAHLGASYTFTKSSSLLKSNLAANLEVGGIYKKHFYFGGLVENSVLPDKLGKSELADLSKLKTYQFGVSLGYITNVSEELYLKLGTRVGYTLIKQENTIAQQIIKSDNNTFTIMPEARIGMSVGKHVGIELGATYRYNLKDKTVYGVSTRDFNGLGGTLGINYSF